MTTQSKVKKKETRIASKSVLLWTLSVVAIAGLLLVTGGVSYAANKVCTTTTLTLNGSSTSPVEVDEGTDITASATVKESSSSGNGCNAGNGQNLDSGNGHTDITAKGVKTDNPDGTPDIYFTCSDPGLGSQTDIVSNGAVPTATGIFSVNGLAAVDLAIADLPVTIGIMADYSGTSNYANSNACVDVMVNPVPVTDCSCVGLDPDIYVFADQASANGVTAGSDFEGSFRIRVKNCLGYDVNDVKVQGGAVAWATSTLDETQGDSGNVTPNYKKRNTVFTWLTDLTVSGEGQCKFIVIDLEGTVDKKAQAGDVYFMSGPWSAAWDNDKSDYTGRVTFTVEAP